jgi:phosphoadenosine phosphosulfate reductase
VRGLAPGEIEAANADELVALAVERHHPRLVLLCSFQKEESVLVDLLAQAAPDARVVTIDTGVLFSETHATWRAFEERFGIGIEAIDASRPGPEPWTAACCCGTAKVAALEQALAGADAWITGIRREQGPTRAATPKLERDERRSLWKFNPLADWTDKDVWRRISERDLPYHPLHDRGYDSVGCAPCTLPGSGRAGRWAGSDKTECGLHVS